MFRVGSAEEMQEEAVTVAGACPELSPAAGSSGWPRHTKATCACAGVPLASGMLSWRRELHSLPHSHSLQSGTAGHR